MLVAVAILAIAIAAALLPTASAARPDPPGQLVPVQLLGFNDYHGYLESGGNPSRQPWAPTRPAAASTSPPS